MDSVYVNVKEELECPICKEVFNNPKTLQCAHIFCCDCVQGLAKMSITNDLICPTCRESTPIPLNGVNSLPTSFHLLALVDKFRQINVTPKYMEHTNRLLCDSHSRDLEFFCEECDEGMCAGCLLGKHKNHQYSPLDGKIGGWLNNLRATLPPSNVALENAANAEEKLKNDQAIITQNKEKVLKEIHAFFGQLKEAISQRENLISTAVETYYMMKMTRLEDTCNKLQIETEAISQRVAFIMSMLEKRSICSLLGGRRIVDELDRHQDITKQYVDSALKLKVSSSFLTFYDDPMLHTRLTEAGTLNECVPIEEADDSYTASFKVRKRLVIKGELNLQFESASNSSDEDQEIYDDVQEVDGEEGERVKSLYVKTVDERSTTPNPTSEDLYEDPICTNPPPLPPARLSISHSDCNRKKDIPRPTSQYGDVIHPDKPIYINTVPPASIINPVRVITNWKMASGTACDKVKPWGLTCGPDNCIYLTDVENHCVRITAPDGCLNRVFGGKGNGKGQFIMPVDIAIDDSCNIYVADRVNGTVQKFSYKGRFKLRFRSSDGENELKQPNGLAVFQNRVYVSDRVAGKVFLYDREGFFQMAIAPIGPVGENQFQPAGIAVDPRFEKLYVADRCNHHVLVFNSDGELVNKIGWKGNGPGQMLFPNGVAITSDNKLVVSETENNRISVFSCVTGAFLCSFGEAGGDKGMFILPRHIGINRQGEVIIADEGNQRIQVFNLIDAESPYLDLRSTPNLYDQVPQ